MEVIYPRCAGLDVHKKTVVTCVRIAGEGPALQKVRTFATTASGLLAVADWLDSHGLRVVAMEATGVYRKPVQHVLECRFELDGHTDLGRPASCISTRVKASRTELLEALHGRVSAHQRFMLKLHLTHIDAQDQAIVAIEKEGLGLDTFRQAAKLLSTMPGLSAVGSNAVIAEIGIDMSRFATPAHLLPWACMCPRNDESAGKRRSTRLRRGGKSLTTTVVQAAWAAIEVKGSYLQAQFHRLRVRRGAKKAIIAVAASMLTAAWHMPRNGTEWHDLGAAHFDRADAHKTATRLIRRLQQIGYAVQITPA